MKTKLILALGVLTLAGCAKPAIQISNFSSVKADDKSVRGIDVYARKRKTGHQAPALKGDQLVTIRTYHAQNEEVKGVPCTLQGKGFSAKFKSPAKVRAPLYGRATSSFTVTCESAKYKKTVVTTEPVNITKAGRYAGVQGLGGVLVMAAANAASDDKKDVFFYPPTHLTLEPKRAGSKR